MKVGWNDRKLDFLHKCGKFQWKIVSWKGSKNKYRVLQIQKMKEHITNKQVIKAIEPIWIKSRVQLFYGNYKWYD